MSTERRQLLKNDKYVEGDDCHLFLDISVGDSDDLMNCLVIK